MAKKIDEAPYLKKVINTYNPLYGDERVCECGHSYYRHFDTYEEMNPIGCKYCSCCDFREDKNRPKFNEIERLILIAALQSKEIDDLCPDVGPNIFMADTLIENIAGRANISKKQYNKTALAKELNQILAKKSTV